MPAGQLGHCLASHVTSPSWQLQVRHVSSACGHVSPWLRSAPSTTHPGRAPARQLSLHSGWGGAGPREAQVQLVHVSRSSSAPAPASRPRHRHRPAPGLCWVWRAQAGQQRPGRWRCWCSGHGSTGQLVRAQLRKPPRQLHSLHGSPGSGLVSPSRSVAPASSHLWRGQTGQQWPGSSRGWGQGAGSHLVVARVSTPSWQEVTSHGLAATSCLHTYTHL